ncbi:MAG: hypothetical protein ACOC34_05755 [Thermotogota bacterium]
MTKELMDKISLVEKKVGKDWIKSLSNISTQEQLEAKVSEWGFYLTPAESREAFALLGKRDDGELSEEELLEVAGGSGCYASAGSGGDK